jgi:ABC-type glycerol-3-phosphate transport system substrate-binding protein
VEIGTPIRSLPVIMMLFRTHLLAIVTGISVIVLSCQNQQHESAGPPAHISVRYLRSGTMFDAFIDSTVNAFGTQAGITASVKSCSLLELLELASHPAGVHGPDVLIVPYQYLPLLASKSLILAYSSARSDDAPGAIAACTWRGVRYGVMLFCQPPVLHINKSVVPNNIDLDKGLSLFDIQQLADAAPFSGQTWGVHGQDAGHQAQTMISWFTLFGGALVDTAGLPTVNSAKNVLALDSYAELAKGNAMETSRQLDALGRLGKLAIWYTHAHGREFTSASHQGGRYDFTFITTNEQPNCTGTFVGMAASIPRSAHDSQLSSKLVDYIREAIVDRAEIGYPSTNAYWDAQVRSAEQENRIKGIFVNSKPVPSSVSWPLIEHTLEEAVLRVLYGQTTSREALDQAQRDLQDLTR